MENRYTKIADYIPERRIPDSAVMVQAGAVLWDSRGKVSLVQLKFRNASTEPVKSIYVKLRLYDHENHPLFIGEKSEIEAEYIDVNAYPRASFGEKMPIAVPSELLRRVEVYVFRIVWKDGRIEEVAGQYEDCAGQESLVEEKKELYWKACGISDGKWKPRIVGDYWQCACGYLTSGEICPACGASREKLFFYLDEKNLAEFQKEEERKKQEEKEERKRKEKKEQRAMLILALVGILILILPSVTDKVKEIVPLIKQEVEDYVAHVEFERRIEEDHRMYETIRELGDMSYEDFWERVERDTRKYLLNQKYDNYEKEFENMLADEEAVMPELGAVPCGRTINVKNRNFVILSTGEMLYEVYGISEWWGLDELSDKISIEEYRNSYNLFIVDKRKRTVIRKTLEQGQKDSYICGIEKDKIYLLQNPDNAGKICIDIWNMEGEAAGSIELSAEKVNGELGFSGEDTYLHFWCSNADNISRRWNTYCLIRDQKITFLMSPEQNYGVPFDKYVIEYDILNDSFQIIEHEKEVSYSR